MPAAQNGNGSMQTRKNTAITVGSFLPQKRKSREVNTVAASGRGCSDEHNLSLKRAPQDINTSEKAQRKKQRLSAGSQPSPGFIQDRSTQIDAALHVPPSRKCGLQTMPEDVMRVILTHLSAVDLQAIRLAGVSSQEASCEVVLRDEFHDRIRGLQSVFNVCERTGFYPFGRAYQTPLHFATVSHVALYELSSEELQTVKRDMPHVRGLSVLLNDGRQPYHGRLRAMLRRSEGALEEALGGKLQVLSLRGQDFREVPECVLRLSGLRELDMSGNTRLKEVPKEVAERLPRLRRLDIRGTEAGETGRVDESVFNVLERNHTLCGRGCCGGVYGIGGASVVRRWPRLALCEGMKAALEEELQLEADWIEDGDAGNEMVKPEVPAMTVGLSWL